MPYICTGSSYTDSGHAGIEFIITARGMPEDCKHLNIRLRLEQHRLLAWGEVSGFLKSVRSPVYENVDKFPDSLPFLVQEANGGLNKIQKLLDDFTRSSLENTGNGKADSQRGFYRDRGDLQLSGRAIYNLFEKNPKSRDSWSRLLHGIEKSSKYFTWAAWNKKRFEGMLQKLSSLNDGIIELTSQRTQLELCKRTEEMNSNILQLYNDTHDIKELVLALRMDNYKNKEDLVKARGYVQPNTGLLGEQSPTSLMDLASFKMLNQSINSVDQDKPQLNSQEHRDHSRKSSVPIIDRKSLYIAEGTNPSMNRCRATFHPAGKAAVSVWVEWKSCDSTINDGTQESPLLLERVEKLVVLLCERTKPAALRVPCCLGYVRDPEEGASASPSRLGFVFQKPCSDEGEERPLSLLQLLRKPEDYFMAGIPPPLGERIKLAYIISATLFSLHAVNWLHKALRSDNVVFFSNGSPASIDLTKPLLSGFDFSRPCARSDMTEPPPPSDDDNDAYRHPRAHGSTPTDSYRKVFDIYSLGIVLVEIAYWDSIDRIMGISHARKPRAVITRFVKENVLRELSMRQLEARVGSRYTEVIKACIDGSLEPNFEVGQDPAMNALILSEEFNERVLKRLQGISC